MSDTSSIPEKKAPAPAERPKGGADAWLRVMGAFILYMNSWGLLSAWGSYQRYYETELLSGYSSSTIAWVGTIQAFLVIFVGVVTGPLFDKGFLRSMLIAGSFLVVFGMMMTSLATQYYQVILAQGVCVGLGGGTVYVPSIAMVTISFAKWRTLAIAIATSGAAIGGIIFPIAFERLQPMIGFPWATRVLGFICLATYIPGLIIILGNNPPSLAKKNARSLIEAGALREVPFMAFSLSRFLTFFSYFIPTFYVPTFAQEVLGTSASFANDLLIIQNAATMPGRIISALVAERIGRHGPSTVMTACAFMGSVILFGWIGVTSTAGYIVWLIFWGFVQGALVAVPNAVTPQLSPSLAVVGTRNGMSIAFSAVGCLVGTPVAGALIPVSTRPFLAVQLIAAAVLLLGAAMCLVPTVHIIRRNRAGNGKV